MCAFTLAEVLITLGIIGVVAAMTIPTIIHKYREKETLTKLKKASSVLSQIYLAAQANDGLYNFSPTPKQSEVEEFFNVYWKQYIKISKECNSPADCKYDSNLPFKYANGSICDYNLVLDGRKSFITNDGVLYFIVVYTIVQGNPIYRHQIFVDVNAGDPPNTFGKDVFAFNYIADKTVFPMGYELTDEGLKCVRNDGSLGLYCAERIRRNGWQIPSDYMFEF